MILPVGVSGDMATKYKMAANIQLQTLVEWAKQIPHFVDLPIDDQVSE